MKKIYTTIRPYATPILIGIAMLGLFYVPDLIILPLLDFLDLSLHFRLMTTLVMSFIFFAPMILAFFGLRGTKAPIAFFVPFIAFGVIKQVFRAVGYGDITLIFSPSFLLTGFMMGAGLGLIGLGGNQYQKNKWISLLLVIGGVILMILKGPNILYFTWYILTGDSSVIPV
ncbi:hypothetical protein RJ40_06605 [Methanofollis aquaemaris]|uniref:Uncharacterized protein n=1 Tax=Methanofollis aquaemaris TaxID=126734 RepID=A0A8A3S564_9EURY|nr:hypothetical protein [Methanofollis aquaemaris]QSZ67192.1 hypothetical protein RJ40_06605 [Methanofollis aquaemaris]